jgi:hypothetical protein
MAIRAEQLHIVNTIIFKVAINMVDFKRHSICHRMALIPAATLALFAAQTNETSPDSGNTPGRQNFCTS